MTNNGDQIIQVRGAWNGWRTAEVRIHDLQDIHWFQPVGAPRHFVHAYLRCTDMISGEIPHDCLRTDGPHRLLVCVLRRSTAADTYRMLARTADCLQEGAAERVLGHTQGSNGAL